MKKINPHKATDIYKITPAIIKDLQDYLPSKITPLYNESIDNNEYPDSLKYTKLIELYKAGDPKLPINYRPISLLPIIAKLLDTIINKQLMDYLLGNRIISPTQYAFRPKSNTTTALQVVVNNLHKQKNKHIPTIALYIDLSKAYDTVSHEKLLKKLRHEFNFTTETTQFFKSYFTNRQQETHTTEAQSTKQTITHGIPQGSTLSTTLFLLYINNIITTVESTVYTYADDTTLIIAIETMSELQDKAQKELDKLIQYFYDNNLVPNPTKTVYTIFNQPHTTNPTTPTTLTIQGKILQQVNTAKLLGIYLQNSLKYDETIKHIVKKLQRPIQLFQYAAKLLPPKHIKRQYYALIYPHLIYAITIWGTQNKTEGYILPLRRAHNKAIRAMTGKPSHMHITPQLIENEILSLDHLYTLRVCIELHPYIYPTKEDEKINKPYTDNTIMLIADIHVHNTRYSKGHIFSPNTNTKARETKQTMAHLTQKHTDIWNTLPSTLRQTSNLKIFKKELGKYLLLVQKEELNNVLKRGHHLG
jgi:hypothetical protein